MRVKFVVKPRKKMRDIIATHWLVDSKVPKGEVWVREDWWKDPVRRKRIKVHEKVEINLMKRGLSYTRAHKVATKFERVALKGRRGKKRG